MKALWRSVLAVGVASLGISAVGGISAFADSQQSLTYSRMAMPLAVPAIATGFIFHFQASWNDFLAPLIYLNSNSNYTLSLGLASFTGACDCTPWNQLMAVSTIVALVPILIFFFAQNYVLRGIVVTTK